MGSKQPIEGVLVYLQDGISSGGFFPPGNTSSNKSNYTYTDKDGKFRVELTGEHGAYLSLSKSRYLFEHEQAGAVQGVKPYSDGNFKNQILEMKAEAYFGPILKSLKESFESDILRVDMLFRLNRSPDPILLKKYEITGFDYELYGKGPFDLKDIAYLSIGHTYQPYKITLKRQGKTYYKLDSVFVKSLETFTDTIYY